MLSNSAAAAMWSSRFPQMSNQNAAIFLSYGKYLVCLGAITTTINCCNGWEKNNLPVHFQTANVLPVNAHEVKPKHLSWHAWDHLLFLCHREARLRRNFVLLQGPQLKPDTFHSHPTARFWWSWGAWRTTTEASSFPEPPRHTIPNSFEWLGDGGLWVLKGNSVTCIWPQ